VRGDVERAKQPKHRGRGCPIKLPRDIFVCILSLVASTSSSHPRPLQLRI
jgi:hypothetical protein